MVFVKVRETYDLATEKGKITVIGIHTPKANIIQENYPGLLMQCKAYRPVACNVRLACASVLPVDPQGVGLAEGDVAPEDLFNPILYKAISNLGMSQIESRIVAGANLEVDGRTASADVNLDTGEDDFNLYYGLLADTNQWKHANPQAGLSMTGLRPMVSELLFAVGDNGSDVVSNALTGTGMNYPGNDGSSVGKSVPVFKGNLKPMPMINCTAYTGASTEDAGVGFDSGIDNAQMFTPAPQIYVGCIIVPPSRLHQLFYRMVVEWTLEFSTIRSVHEITDWTGLRLMGERSHYQNYDYSTAKTVLGMPEDETIAKDDTSMVSSTVDIKKVM